MSERDRGSDHERLMAHQQEAFDAVDLLASRPSDVATNAFTVDKQVTIGEVTNGATTFALDPPVSLSPGLWGLHLVDGKPEFVRLDPSDATELGLGES